jgi:hypothetical protein
MSRIANLAASSAVAAALVGLGCQDASTPDTETFTAAVTGTGGSVGSYVRGYTAEHLNGQGGTHGDAGQPTGHALVYRDSLTGAVIRLTPGTHPPANLGGNLAVASAPWGYVRADVVDAVLYIDANRHVHEITQSGPTSFVDRDYSAAPVSAPLAAPAPLNGQVPDVIGYVRADGNSAVIYRSDTNHVIEIANQSISWVVTDLTSSSSATVTVGRGGPFPYVRTDGYNSVVYIASDNHMHELAMISPPNWADYDLFVASGNTGASMPISDPWGYQRSDGYNSVLYISIDRLMHELAYHSGGGWGNYVLPASIGPNDRPSGYVRKDGISTVVFVNNFGLVHELALVGGSWSDAELPNGGYSPVGQLFGHQAPQSTGSILFEGLLSGSTDSGSTDPRAVEISLTGTTWTATAF